MTNASFEIAARAKESPARTGLLRTPHGDIETPVFMPVATQAAVKAVTQEDLERLGVRAILANSYHLALRPGCAEIETAGGLHAYMRFDGMILTDSGGFQVWSQSGLRQIAEDGVEFRSHIDGRTLRLTPEGVIENQARLGSDCWTVLDVCPAFPCPVAELQEALRRTWAWAEASAPALARWREQGKKCLYFPILQGCLYPQWRERSVEHLLALPHDGVALGGLSVGEPKERTWEAVEAVSRLLPESVPRYLMGVGTPDDAWEAVARGADMMDCVYPTRVARNGMVLTRRGRYNVTVSASRGNSEPLEPGCACWVCSRYSRAYLRHLFAARELSVYRMLTYHNLHLMEAVMREIRASIRDGGFSSRRREALSELAARGG